MLIPLHVLEHTTLDSDGDTVAPVGTEGDGIGGESPAVEVTTDADGHVGQTLGDEVIASVEVERPVLRGLNATR